MAQPIEDTRPVAQPREESRPVYQPFDIETPRKTAEAAFQSGRNGLPKDGRATS